MKFIITNILKLNKLENQEIQEKHEAFNVTDSLSDSVVSFESWIEKKNIELIKKRLMEQKSCEH